MKKAAKIPTVRPAQADRRDRLADRRRLEPFDERRDHRGETEHEHREVSDEHRPVRPPEVGSRPCERAHVVFQHGGCELAQLGRRTNGIPVPRAGQPHHHGMPS